MKKTGYRGERRKIKKKYPVVPVLIIAVCVVVFVGVFLTFWEWQSPTLTIRSEISRIGPEEELIFEINDAKSGVRSFAVYFEQEGKQYEMFHKSFLRKDRYPYPGPELVREEKIFHVKTLGVDEGEASLVIVARDFSFWGWFEGNSVIKQIPVIIDTIPPAVALKKKPHYMKPGSAAVLVYKVNEPLASHGVMINGYFHPGYALPHKGANVYGATIALHFDEDRIRESHVLVTDLTGNETKNPFGIEVQKRAVVKDEISITNGFLDRKIPEFERSYPDMPGTKLEKYIHINNQIRSANNKKIKEICAVSMQEKKWQGAFLRLQGSARKANFADRRTYKYEGNEIDHQTHLGIDLASTRFAEVEAANHGKVVFAGELGIYGNMIMLDHGLGVFSLYSHLSQISVALDEMVPKGKVIGLTGKSGMAGGDHLHFSMLINGVFVDPVEWWDARWLQHNMENPL